MRIAKVIGGVLGGLVGLVLLLLLVLSSLNWNVFRADIAAQSKKRLGRTLRIEGDLVVKLVTSCPRVDAYGVRFENAAWAKDPSLFKADHAGVSICLWPLLKRELQIKALDVESAQVALEKSKAGVWSSDLGLSGRSTGQTNVSDQPDPAEAEETDGQINLPVWKSVDVKDFRLSTVDHATGKRVDLVVTELMSRRRSDDEPVVLRGSGTLQTLPFDVDASFEPGEALSAGLGFKAKARLSQIHLDARGKIGDVRTLDPFEGQLSLEARGLSDVMRTIGYPLNDEVAAISLSTGVAREGRTIRIGSMRAAVGRSKASGWVAVDIAERPTIRGVVKVPLLRFADIGSFIPKKVAAETPAAKKAKAEAEGDEKAPILSSETFATEALRALNADVELTIDRYEGPGRAALLDSLYAKIGLVDGRLELQPFKLGLAGGSVDAKATLDGSGKILAADVGLALRRLDMKSVFDTFVPDIAIGKIHANELLTGKIDGRVELTSKGDSLKALAQQLDGDIELAMEEGKISSVLVEAAGFDLTELLGSLTAKKQTLALDCLLADFAVKDGLIDTKGFIIGTPDSNIVMTGQVDLGKEELNLEFRTLAKDFSIGSVNAPIDVEGRFADPKVRPRKLPFFGRIAAAIGLGAFAGPAAILPLIEPGMEVSGRCKAYSTKIAAVRRESEESAH